MPNTLCSRADSLSSTVGFFVTGKQRYCTDTSQMESNVQSNIRYQVRWRIFALRSHQSDWFTLPFAHTETFLRDIYYLHFRTYSLGNRFKWSKQGKQKNILWYKINIDYPHLYEMNAWVMYVLFTIIGCICTEIRRQPEKLRLTYHPRCWPH